MRFLGIPVPRALPWAGMLFTLRGGIPDRATSIRGVEGLPFPVPSARAGPTPTRRAQVLMLRPLGRRPKGAVTNQAQGNALGITNSHVPALKGRNRMRSFTCDCDIATAETCVPLQGIPFLGIPCSQGVALGWHVVSPSGRNSRSRNTDTGRRGDYHFPFLPHARVPHQPDAQVLMLRLWVVAPKGQSQISPGQRPLDYPLLFPRASAPRRHCSKVSRPLHTVCQPGSPSLLRQRKPPRLAKAGKNHFRDDRFGSFQQTRKHTLTIPVGTTFAAGRSGS